MIVELGKAYTFEWFGKPMTGIAVRCRSGWVTFRTRTKSFSVPVEHVLAAVS